MQRLNKERELAELAGIILGDGHLHHKCNKIIISGSFWDKYYYENNVRNLFKKIFNVKSNIYKVGNKNAYILQVENKSVFDFLIHKVGLVRGRKVGRVRIPKKFVKSEILRPFLLRGLFDTDGTVTFSKQNKDYAYYPRVKISSQRSPMIKQIKYCLDKLNFNYSIDKDCRTGNIIYNFEVAGKENFVKWMKLVGSSNPVHYTKYLIWKKFGYYDKSWDFRKRALLLGNKNFFKDT